MLECPQHTNRNIIILAGGFGLPDRTASAIRAVGLASLLQLVGYHVIMLGKLPPQEGQGEHLTKINLDGIDCYDIEQPFPNVKYGRYDRNSDTIFAVIDEIGAQHVYAVFLYNYPSPPSFDLYFKARRQNIKVGLDLTEWYGWEGRKIARNIVRVADSEVRMRIVTRLFGNVISASSQMAHKLRPIQSLVLPFPIDSTASKWQDKKRSPIPNDGPFRFVYSGSPGVGLQKDNIPAAIEAFSNLHGKGHDFNLDVFGLTADQYLDLIPGHTGLLTDMQKHIQFFGRVSHADSLERIRSAHFSVFFRKPSAQNNMGFPTKLMEAVTLGVPVITNSTSDISMFVQSGINGFLTESYQSDAIRNTLETAIKLTPETYAIMRKMQRLHNPFDIKNWRSDMVHFLQYLV